MVMNPRTHPRGAPPDFTLPRPNPNPSRMTDALWWLVCMRLQLEPLSRNGGTFAPKDGYHNAGENLPGHGSGGGGKASTDHSIRYAWDRSGPWWLEYSSAHDWTFVDAQAGDFTTIRLYTKRLTDAMADPRDTRPDSVYVYTLGQVDNDRQVEGYNERRDASESSGDLTHLWHRHDSFRRNIIGSFSAMWKALTIDMGWTFAEWERSVAPAPAKPGPVNQDKEQDMLQDEPVTVTKTTGTELYEPDLKAGTQVTFGQLLQLAAIWARRAAINTDTLEREVTALHEKVDHLTQLLESALTPPEPTEPGPGMPNGSPAGGS